MATAVAPSVQSRRSLTFGSVLRATAIALAIVGIFAAVVRTVVVAQTLATPVGDRPELSAYDEKAIGLLFSLSGIEPGSAEGTRTRGDIVRMGEKYVDHARYTFAHMLPGILILLLAPLQFSAEVRRRHVRIHRWSGRLVLVMVVLVAISGFRFGVVDSNVPALERPTIVIFSGLFLFAAARAFVAIRAHDVRRHREWMIRMVAMAVGIGAVRVVSLPLLLLVRARWETTFVLSMWVGWVLSIGAAELWIRHTRRHPVSVLATPA
jgi:hypothetical protein